MKILYSLLLIVTVLVCVQFAHAYGALAVTLRLDNWLVKNNTASAHMGTFGLENGTFSVYANVNDDGDPGQSGQGSYGSEWVFASVGDAGPLHSSAVANAYVNGYDKWGNFQHDDDSDNN